MEKTKKEAKKKHTDKDKLTELTDTLKRLQAEFENYKKRVDKEKEEFVKYSKADLIVNLLPILDSFEMGLRNKDSKEFVKGMELVFSQFVTELEKEGLRPIRTEEKFDPYLHEVMLKEKSDKEDGLILEELQKGYMLNDKVLRHSKVKVSEKDSKKTKSKDKTTSDNEGGGNNTSQ
mgnify:CR=1 FL=1